MESIFEVTEEEVKRAKKAASEEYAEAGFLIGDLAKLCMEVTMIIGRDAYPSTRNSAGVDAIFNWIKTLKGKEAEMVLRIASFFIMKEISKIVSEMTMEALKKQMGGISPPAGFPGA